ncbi:hypothetical protein L209DRAFT_104338 [Thermothelomyces heterothallicus CBS 203.75]
MTGEGPEHIIHSLHSLVARRQARRGASLEVRLLLYPCNRPTDDDMREHAPNNYTLINFSSKHLSSRYRSAIGFPVVRGDVSGSISNEKDQENTKTFVTVPAMSSWRPARVTGPVESRQPVPDLTATPITPIISTRLCLSPYPRDPSSQRQPCQLLGHDRACATIAEHCPFAKRPTSSGINKHHVPACCCVRGSCSSSSSSSSVPPSRASWRKVYPKEDNEWHSPNPLAPAWNSVGKLEQWERSKEGSIAVASKV